MSALKEWLTTAGELVGGALFAYGVYQYAHPAGAIAAGALLVLFAWLADR